MPLVLVPCAGCVLPIPHTTASSREFSGRVLDAVTHAPVSGARVFLDEHPSTFCLTDNDGYFRLRGTKNFHWAYRVPEGDVPDAKGYDYVKVSHTNYLSQLIYTLDHKGDVLLVPKP